MTTTDTLTVREGEETVVVDLREGVEIGLHELAMVRHWLATIRMSRAVRPQTYKRYAERLEEWLPIPFSTRRRGGMTDSAGNQHGLTLDELMAELDARRAGSDSTWCYNCEELVEVEPDNGGCGCHCPECEITL